MFICTEVLVISKTFYLTTTEVLKKISKALDDINVLLAIFTGIANKHFGSGSLSFHMEACRVG